jgi:DNA-directed RNA polymerase III subunit RPC6
MQDPEEKVIYKLIAAAGNKGVWLRDIRQASNLPMTQVTKLLKVLEGKKIVKAIKSVSVSYDFVTRDRLKFDTETESSVPST